MAIEKERWRERVTRTPAEDTRYWHFPVTHPCPAEQVVPHVPQLLASVWRSEQVPAQFVVPVGHSHVPLTQTRFPPHTSPQSPQLFLLFSKSTHAGGVPHEVKPDAEQRTAHVPSLHTGSAPVQAFPQEPQFRSFEERSTQLPAPPFLPAHCV